jgi:hypothetical protein
VPPPIPIPPDVQAWIRNLFGDCNAHVAATMSRVPTIHETTLDMAFIDHLTVNATPTELPSGWLVQINTYYLGGTRHFPVWPEHATWEVADIGVLVMFRHGGKLIRSKVALLQSKRLYPDELELDEDSPVDYMIGFGGLLQADDEWAKLTAPRPFTFGPQSRYKALLKVTRQYAAITAYETDRAVPVHYLLYHPLQIPYTVTVPLTPDCNVTGHCEAGCRVVPARDLHHALRHQPAGHTPAYAELHRNLPARFTQNQHQGGWRLENFVVDQLLQCEAGYIADDPSDSNLYYVFRRRTGPIAAAISLTIDAPATISAPAGSP